jgi:cobyrinic acid a,c-diamide synthase
VDVPRILIAGVRGGSGKTLISLGLLAAWRRQGLRVAPFKKGPDYIDAAWLSLAAARPCRNLDLFLMSPQTALGSFADSTADSHIAVIEGNRGLYDGMDAQGSYSTAQLAKLLQAPVVLATDCTKATRTVAAVVLGCQQLDPQVRLKGVILNQTAGPRHESVLREAVEGDCGLPVVGVIPRIPEPLFPERHLGLVPPQEHGGLKTAIQRAADVAEDHLDLQAIWELAKGAPALEPPTQSPAIGAAPATELARIGVFRDAAFQFYYPDNLEALEREGARLIEVSPIRDTTLPAVDALYVGGGFPETLALSLSENRPFRDSLRRAIEAHLPVYAECGGTVYLGEKLLFQGKEYPMVGALPVVFAFRNKPQGHGYTVLETVHDNPFYPVGVHIRGHEFHYTYMHSSAEDLSFAFRVLRGFGFDGERDGLRHRNALACYTHIHALGTESWARALVSAAARFHAHSNSA